MSSNEDDYSSEEDEDYIPEENFGSEDEEVQEENKEESNDQLTSKENYSKKEKVDELWKNFKQDVEKQTVSQNKSETIVDKNTSDGDIGSATSNHNRPENTNKVEPVVGDDDDTVTITKVYDFAGEDVKVTKEVKRDSAEAQNHFKEQASFQPAKRIIGRTSGILNKRPGGGIGSVLGKLGKKPKLSTLEKSKLDWNQYKEDEDIEEELQAYNKGKQGYLEKVSFLERTEMRQFEKERDMRLSKSARR